MENWHIINFDNAVIVEERGRIESSSLCRVSTVIASVLSGQTAGESEVKKKQTFSSCLGKLSSALLQGVCYPFFPALR